MNQANHAHNVLTKRTIDCLLKAAHNNFIIVAVISRLAVKGPGLCPTLHIGMRVTKIHTHHLKMHVYPLYMCA